jgi:hypothetical protein
MIRAGLMKRATNINEDYVSDMGTLRYFVRQANMHKPFAFAFPAGTTCTGTVAGQSIDCMVKIVNPQMQVHSVDVLLCRSLIRQQQREPLLNDYVFRSVSTSTNLWGQNVCIIY